MDSSKVGQGRGRPVDWEMVRKVLALKGRGVSDSEIARILSTPEKKVHRRSVLRWKARGQAE